MIIQKNIHCTIDNEILSYIAKIHEYKGKQELYVRQKKDKLEKLIEIAKVQSTESSNKIEGIVSTNTRIKHLVADKTTPRNRDEKEIMGYREVLKFYLLRFHLWKLQLQWNSFAKPLIKQLTKKK